MARKERLTRREASKVLSISSLGIIVPYLIIRGPHYLAYLDSRSNEDSSNEESSLSSHVFATDENYQFSVKEEGERYTARVNIDAFSDALALISNNEVEGYGRLKRFVRLNPLRIHLQEHLPQIEAKDGRSSEPKARYDGALFGGPIIRFPESYLKKYAKRVLRKELDNQADSDTTVYHELIHFWQDLRNPYKYFLLTSYCCVNFGLDDKNLIDKVYPEDDVFEDEALSKSKQIVQSLRAGHISGKIKEWPFGHFFSIKKI